MYTIFCVRFGYMCPDELETDTFLRSVHEWCRDSSRTCPGVPRRRCLLRGPPPGSWLTRPSDPETSSFPLHGLGHNLRWDRVSRMHPGDTSPLIDWTDVSDLYAPFRSTGRPRVETGPGKSGPEPGTTVDRPPDGAPGRPCTDTTCVDQKVLNCFPSGPTHLSAEGVRPVTGPRGHDYTQVGPTIPAPRATSRTRSTGLSGRDNEVTRPGPTPGGVNTRIMTLVSVVGVGSPRL